MLHLLHIGKLPDCTRHSQAQALVIGSTAATEPMLMMMPCSKDTPSHHSVRLCMRPPAHICPQLQTRSEAQSHLLLVFHAGRDQPVQEQAYIFSHHTLHEI
jgi:hypothetical protein